jgi:hypothetical protein
VEKNNVGAAFPTAWDKMIGLHPATVGTLLNESGMADGMIWCPQSSGETSIASITKDHN